MGLVNRQMLQSALEGECMVTFTKINGERRVMRCTLNSAYLPESNKEKGQLLTEANPNLMTDWDLDANGWRSFHIDSVQSLTIENNATGSQELLLG